MKTPIKNFVRIVVFVAIMVVVVGVFAKEEVIKNAANGVVNWVCTTMGLTAPNLF